MWKPAERIKYQTEVASWPDAQGAATSRLFSPIGIGSMSLEQRTWIPAMVPWRSNEEGEVTQDVIDWYGRFAEGKPGAIVIEATGIRDIPSGPLLRISNDGYVPGLKRLVETVREASNGQTRLLIQLIDFLNIRRRPDPVKYFERFWQLPISIASCSTCRVQTSPQCVRSSGNSVIVNLSKCYRPKN